MLTITEAASQQITSIMEAQGRQGDHLRIGIIGRSGGDFRYTMNIIEEGQENADDVAVDSENFKVFIDAQSAPNMEGATIDYISNGLHGSGFKIDNPNPLWTDPVALQAQEVIDSQINPNLASHGGMVDLLDVKDGIAYVRLGGGCQGCGMVDVTLRHGIEALLTETVAGITQVMDTTDHASGNNPYYQPAKG
jgi:Fe/S biogenesis protein NfuA